MWWICLIWGSEFILGCQQMTIAGAVSHWYFRLSARADKGSECAKCGLKCGICCFYCLEKFIRYLNHNAYTIITIESVGDFILFLGKCIVTAVTGIIGLLLLKRNTDLHFYAAPTLVICIYSFFIAHCMLSLYEMVVDSLFLCVCEDRNMNGVEGKWKHSRLAELGGHAREPEPGGAGAELRELDDKY
ncbi:Choline transporter-like protein 1 [Operophtera brumata]|uniref:Choline transporter-like protein n=1 Tax=Operophtera brumata TaxID=104452 RepID=A0A0L7KU67_OPEBR|nr:Choline transporter-like protein 1 [Operophtera brumata]